MDSIEEPLLHNPLYIDDEPIYETCGVQISLRDVPDSITINHAIPKHYSNLRKEENHFDIIIKLDEIEWKAHKAVLCVKIPLVLVVTNPNWPDTKIINIPSEFDSTVLESIIDYTYNGSLIVNESNAQSMMMLGNYLLMDWLVEDCAYFLLKRIRFDDSLPLLTFFQSLNYTKLDPLITFIDMKFVLISNTLQFTELSIDDLVNILHRDSLRIDDEGQVFNAISRWIGGNTDRVTHGMRLMKCIRMNRISSSFFTTIEKTDWVMDNQECFDWIKSKDHSGKRRINEYAPKIAFSAFMEERRGNIPVQIYNPITNSWIRASIPLETRVSKVDGACTTWNEEIIFVGGGMSQWRSGAGCFMYNTRKNSWKEIPALNEDRCNLVAEVIDGKVYCAGGRVGDATVKSMEMFNLADPSQGWSVLPEMSKGRAWAASCVLDGILYVFGDEGVLDDGERFDPTTNTWSPITKVPRRRYEFTAAALNGSIYIVGGERDSFTDVYSPSTNTWKSVRCMNKPRNSPQVIVMYEKLYVFGGENEGKFMDTVESYDPINDTWKDEQPML